jgi:outer membrane protein OmpA-like peptidoglycan-associated protein
MHRIPLLAVAAAIAVLAGCSSLPATNTALEQARSEYAAARSDSRTATLAPSELTQAGDALKSANDAWSREDSRATIDHLAYVARQRVAIAQTTARQKGAEADVAKADSSRDKIRLAARTIEVDVAQRDTQDALRQSAQSKAQTDAAQQQAATSRQATTDAQARTAQLETQMEAQLKTLDAKKTDRGMVMTLGDVLFDTNQAELKAGGLRSVEKLVVFLGEYPQRTALIEGFTDSTGSDGLNQALSGRRADAVRAALVNLGVSPARITTRGYGEAYPVATNDNLAGRQQNRRVEIVLSDDNGRVAPR